MRSDGRRRKDKKSDDEGGGAPEWMTTFGDLMSLLLTFFVLIVSFSSVQMVEFQKALGSLKGALGVLPFHKSPINPSEMQMPMLSGFDQTEMQDRIEEMEKFIKKEELADEVDFNISKNGIAIRMKEKLLFDLGKADLKPSADPILQKIGALAKDWPNNVRVEGHTDNLPIHTPKFPSNWELSAIRAINVVHFLQEKCQVPPTKIYSIGYGENRPLVPNDSPENRSKNRRVEIYLEN